MLISPEVIEVDLSEPYTKADIVESVEQMPHKAKCFMSYLYAAAFDLLDEVLHGRDLLVEVRKLDREFEDSARQCCVGFKARAKLRAIGMGMNRGRLGDDPFEKLLPLLEEADDRDPTVFSVTFDAYLCIDLLLGGKDDADDYEALLAARLKEVGTPPKKMRFLQRAYRDLQGLAAFIHERNLNFSETFPTEAVNAEEMEHELSLIRSEDRPAYAAMISNLSALVAVESPLSREGLTERLDDSSLSDSEREVVIDEVLEVSSFGLGWDDRISDWEDQKGYASLRKTAERLAKRFDEDDENPLLTALVIMYRCCSELYETEETELTDAVTPETHDEGAVCSVRAAKYILEELYGSLDEDETEISAGELLSDEAVSLAGKAIPLLKTKLSWDKFHALGVTFNGAAQALAAIRGVDKVRNSFVTEALMTPEMLVTALERAEFVMASAIAYVDGEDYVPLEVVEAMTGKKGGFEAAVNGIVMLPERFVEDTAHAFMTLPDDIAEDVFLGVGAAGGLFQMIERLPDSVQDMLFSMSGSPAAYPKTAVQILMMIADRMIDIREAVEEAVEHRGALN